MFNNGKFWIEDRKMFCNKPSQNNNQNTNDSSSNYNLIDNLWEQNLYKDPLDINWRRILGRKYLTGDSFYYDNSMSNSSYVLLRNISLPYAGEYHL